MQKLIGAAAASVTVLLTTEAALAEGRFPLSNQIVFSPSDPNLIVARTSYGILPSHDNGATWGYLCEDALGLPQTASVDPQIDLTETNTLLAGVYSPFAGIDVNAVAGLDVSTDLGCNWTCGGGSLAHQGVADLVVRPEAPDVVLAITSTNVPTDAGGPQTYQSQVFRSTDDGAHWAMLGAPLDPKVLVQTIEVSKSDPHRIYVSGTRGFGSFRTASLFVSTDDGATWQERPLTAFDPSTEYSIYLAAVDPADPNRLYLRSSGVPDSPGQSRLFVTSDGGESFQAVKMFDIPPPPPGVVTGVSEILGFAISPDGSKIFAGSREEGLFVANKSDLMFHQTSSIAVQCLATRGNELWACSDAKSGFIIGESTDDGATFTPKMRLVTSLTGTMACAPNPGGPLACAATVNGSQCQASLDYICQSYSSTGQCGDQRDSGVTEGGTGDQSDSGLAEGGVGREPGSSGCGCSAAGGQAAGAIGALMSGVAGIVLRRRRRRASAV